MTDFAPDDCLDVIVVGAGQSGLAIAYHLARQRARFVVVDAAAELGAVWRSRWDSLTLFTPAQYDALPGMAFPGSPDTYPTKDQVADYLAAYAARFELPVLLRCQVNCIERVGDRFTVGTNQGDLRARQVVIATGAFHRPNTPKLAGDLPPNLTQVHSAEYRHSGALPEGPVVVVGSGNSGQQIAAELSASRTVFLAQGAKALELPQRIWSRDLFWWLTRTRLIHRTADSRLVRRMRARGDLVIGSSTRRLAEQGVILKPRVVGAGPGGIRFADGTTVAPAAVVWATGFTSDYSWIRVPGVIDGGQVVHRRGVTDVPGLFFLGLPWQHTRGSALLGFVQHDAAWLADQMHAQRPCSSGTADAGGVVAG